MSLVIGLTGGIASGKSTIANIMKENNIYVIDADIEARLAVEKGMEAYDKIVETFGSEICLPDGSINRERLGAIVFNDKNKREQLNKIVHPAVRKQMLTKTEIAKKNNEQFIVLDIPLLYEGKLMTIVDKVIVVFVDEQTQINRLMERNNYTNEQALARIKSQMPLEEKRKLADAVIDNNKTVEHSEKQLMNILHSWGYTFN